MPHDAWAIRSTDAPGYRFEWHPGVRNIYLVREGVVPEHGELIAEKIDSRDAAHRHVHVWLHGFKEAARATIGKPHLLHS